MTRNWTGKVFIATTVDGFIARPHGDLDWLEPRGDSADHVPAQELPAELTYEGHMASVDTLVMGRATFEKVLSFGDWPYPEHRVLVLSTTLTDTDPKVTVVPSIEAALAELERVQARGVYIDGGRVVQEFLSRGLVDDIVLTRVPILIGEGIALFGALPADIALIHRGTYALPEGMFSTHYAVQNTEA